MPFFAYRIEQSKQNYKLLHPVELAGRHGPLPVFARLKSGNKPASGFHLSEAELLDLLALQPADRHAVLTGIRPHEKPFVELFRLLDLWCFSYREWTPVLLRVRQLTDENSLAPDPTAFTRSFRIKPCPHAVYELRHLIGGTMDPAWKWGAARSSLPLQPDAIEFFARSVKPYAEPTAPVDEETVVLDQVASLTTLDRAG